MINQAIAEIFFEIADLLDIQGVQWKPRAYRQAARYIEGMKGDVSELYRKKGIEGLKEIPGVGENIAGKIEEFIKTGKIKARERLAKKIPSHINLLVKIPGMGPRKVKKLNEKLKITTVAGLAKAAKEHKIAGIPGFGAKSEKQILESIALMKKAKNRIKISEARKIAKRVAGVLENVKGVLDISTAGSLRRGKKVIGDIDILVSSKKSESGNIINSFVKMGSVAKVIAKGPTKASVVLKSGVQVDLRVLPPESWGAGLFYFTGSRNYNILMRKKAIERGWKLSEYGLFDRKGKMIAGKTEKGICRKLKVKYMKPEDREM